MCSPATAFFFGIIALFFQFCTLPSALALVPLAQGLSNVDSEWAQLLPGSIDSLGRETDGEKEEVVTNTHQVCCTVYEPLIEKVYLACEGGRSSLYYDFSFFHSPIHFTYLPSTPTYFFSHVYLEVKKREQTNLESKTDHEISSHCSCTRIHLRRHLIWMPQTRFWDWDRKQTNSSYHT